MTSSGVPWLNELLGSAAAAAGADCFDNTLGLPAAPHVVVLLVDGMGEALLEDHEHLTPFLNSGSRPSELLSVIPSTTSANLTSLGTGLLPGKHGMAGYTCRIPGTQRVLNTLRWSDDVDPLVWQPHETVFDRLRGQITPVVVNNPDFEHSGLTRAGFRGADFIGAATAWERDIAVLNVIEQSDRSLVYCYESRLDFAGHAHGVDSNEWRQVLSELDREFRDFHSTLPRGTVLVVTADHGMVDVPVDDRFDIAAHPELSEGVVLVAGEARFRHVHTTAGAEQEVAARWRELLGERVDVRLRADANEWFRGVDDEVAGRFGDVMVASLGDFAVFNSVHQEIELFMKGFHGSVTQRERRVPLRVWV